MGDESESPDAALMRTVTDGFHMGQCKRGHSATYKLRFYWGSGVAGGRPIRESDPFTLDPPEVLAQVQSRLAAMRGAPAGDFYEDVGAPAGQAPSGPGGCRRLW